MYNIHNTNTALQMTRKSNNLLGRHSGSTIAPDHPPKQFQAWNGPSLAMNNPNVVENNLLRGSSSPIGSPLSIQHDDGRFPEDVTALAERGAEPKIDNPKNPVSKTYNTLKEMFSAKFKKDSNEYPGELNNNPTLVQSKYPQASNHETPRDNDCKSHYFALPKRHLPVETFVQQQSIRNPQDHSPRMIECGNRTVSQPHLNMPAERQQKHQNNLPNKAPLTGGSLANIDVTDSDDGGFNTKTNDRRKLFPSEILQLTSHARQTINNISQSNAQSSVCSTPVINQQNYQQHQFQHGKPAFHNFITSGLTNEHNFPPQSGNNEDKSDLIRMNLQSQLVSSVQSIDMLKTAEDGRKTITQDLNKALCASGSSSEYEKNGPKGSNVDSGRGSASYTSSQKCNEQLLRPKRESVGKISKEMDNDSEWVDVVDVELRNILQPRKVNVPHNPSSTLSESVSSITPPLPPLSPGGSARNKKCQDVSKDLTKQAYGTDSYNRPHSGPIGPSRAGWPSSAVLPRQNLSTSKKQEQIIFKKHLFGLDNDITSTTTRSLDMESLLGTPWGATQSISDSETDTQGLRHIRSQLEGLEHMYGEVLRMLGSKMGGNVQTPNETVRIMSRRRHGSLSSLPSSSVSGRPYKDRRKTDDRRRVRDVKGINKRFQRLESHVVTLARSVAHLSSEMRSQHSLSDELDRIRDDLSNLKIQAAKIQNFYPNRGANEIDMSCGNKKNDTEQLNLTNPKRVKKLTKFFGEDPPLMRIFLRKLGYEKYANIFETERIGMIELPYLGEERLQKLGIPLGPRLRILQEAQISLCKDTTLCIV